MNKLTPTQPIDYLLIGHLCKDLTPQGEMLGGTVSYAALTARALGLRVGIVSAFNGAENLHTPLNGIPIVNLGRAKTTTFENVETPQGRRQRLHQRGAEITLDAVPKAWRRAKIIHLAPIIDELPSALTSGFAPTLLGVTPQGWMRTWDNEGNVSPKKWSQAEASLNHVGAAVLSLEDVEEDDELIEALSLACRVLVITEGAEGARLYWNQDLRRFPAPTVKYEDSTGAGDIFAATFFIRLLQTRDPWEAARFATCLASQSVQRRGMESIPTAEEIQHCQMEVL